MDPVTLAVGALAAGAATGLTSATAKAILDGYEALKKWIASKYPDAPTASVEKKPESGARRAALDEVLRDEGANSDEELVRVATALLKAIEASEPTAAESVGVDLSKVWASSIEIERVKATEGSTAIRASEVTAGTIRISDVETSGAAPDHP